MNRVIYKYPFGHGGGALHVTGQNPIVRSVGFQQMEWPGEHRNHTPFVAYVEHDFPTPPSEGVDVWLYVAHTGETLPLVIHEDKRTKFVGTVIDPTTGYVLHVYEVARR